MRIILVGDVVGKAGRQLTLRAVPLLREQHGVDLIVVNAENAAGGSGLTPAIYHELIRGGVDCITMGDHIYRRRELFPVLDNEPRIVRPANYPDSSHGSDYAIVRSASQVPAAVISAQGRVFMPPVDCPFRAVDRVLAKLPLEIKVILVDFHAEATSDMQLMGRHLDGRVSAVLGTHTHVTTADEQILPGRTAFQCDVGMTGAHESIIGREVEKVLEATLAFRPTHFDVATGGAELHGTVVEVDPNNGRATGIERIVIREQDVAS